MNKVKLVVLGLTATAMMINTSCSKDNPLNPLGVCSGSASWVEVISTETTAYTNAITAYNDDPTDVNCSEVKLAGKNYLDALSNVAQCVPTVNQAQYDEAIAEAKKDIDERDCDG